MHKFDYSFLEEGLLPAEFVNLASSIAAFNAIAKYRKNDNNNIYLQLEKKARVQSIKYSNAIEGIITTDARIQEIATKNSTPLNHSEMEIAGYRDALDIIHQNHQNIAFDENLLLLLHKTITQIAGYELSGKYKTENNLILEFDANENRRVRFAPIEAKDTKNAIEQLIYAYNDADSNPKINKLLLIPCVILDFLCIHPFTDGNGRVSRLLSLLLLYKNGYDVGKYVSFEQQINISKDNYYEALENSSIGWHDNQNSYFDFMKNFLSTLYKCYKQLDVCFAEVNVKKGNKSKRIENIVLNNVLPISKKEIADLLPDVSVTTIEMSLGKMINNGQIVKIGSGPATKYANSKYLKKN